VATTITTASGTESALLALRYGYDREQRSIVHEIIGTEYPAITLTRAASRSGILTLLCESIESARAVEALLTAGEIVAIYADTYSDSEPETYSFAAVGRLSVTEEEGTSRWLVTTGFREVDA
jgi:hypothetical protein